MNWIAMSVTLFQKLTRCAAVEDERRVKVLDKSATSKLAHRAKKRSGIAVLFVLAVLCVTLAISYALSRRSVTTASLSVHESGGLQARSSVGASVTDSLVSLRNNPNWMPSDSTTSGSFSSDERHQITLELSNNAQERVIDAAAQIYDFAGVSTIAQGATTSTIASVRSDRPIADQRLRIRLTKQTRNDLPTAAITAFETTVNQNNDAPVFVATGNIVRGNVRSQGPIYFQQGFLLEGSPRVMQNVSRSGTDSDPYVNYRANWGTTYSAEPLTENGHSEVHSSLRLHDVVLGPTSNNPMGVFYFQGAELILDDNVQIDGTLAVKGNLTIRGDGIHLIALQQVQSPAESAGQGTVTTVVSGVSTLLSGVGVQSSTAVLSENAIKTSFPAIVVDGDINIESRADNVRIAGVVLAKGAFRRQSSGSGNLHCGHDHTKLLTTITSPLTSVDGPAVYIQGAIMAGRVHLEHRTERPFALVYDAAVTDVRDAPGFFTWRVAEWTEAN